MQPEDEVNKEPFSEGEIIWDETTAVEYVDSAILTLEKLQEIDISQFTELEKSYIKKTKKRLVRIMHHYVGEIFHDMIIVDKPDEKEDEE